METQRGSIVEGFCLENTMISEGWKVEKELFIMGNREGDGLLIGNILSIFSLRSFNCEENSIVRKIVLIEENIIHWEENSINCEENSLYCEE